jgi:hypothetical protein
MGRVFGVVVGVREGGFGPWVLKAEGGQPALFDRHGFLK